MSKSSTTSSNEHVPSIHTFQMDSSRVGALKNSVNLFRGDVNYKQTIFSLPGRTNGDGLDVTVAIQYQSNVNQQFFTRNLDAPTGILGLAFSQGFPVIQIQTNGSLTPGSCSYSINTGGGNSALVPEVSPPVLFSMPASLASQLKDGATVPTAVRAQFVSLGLPLSTTATIHGNASPWRIQDDDLQQEYSLVSEKGVLDVYDGGQVFQRASFDFSKVIYYSRYERWLVVSASGQRSSFGGQCFHGDGTPVVANHCNTSVGNSIEWGVAWTDAQGTPLWIGNSSNLTRQKQYAKAWRLAQVYSAFGESIQYTYEQTLQAVGTSSGLVYTKSCYPSSITDIYGRRVLFQYQGKQWSATTAASFREYADPYKAQPDHQPNGFQSCYEDRFLDKIVVQDPLGDTIFSVKFDYQVVNLAQPSSGDFCKRLLSGFRLVNANGDSLPGYQYAYYLDPTESTNLGALKRITYPNGGTATYSYTSAQLPVCNRDITLTPPSPLPSNSIPRVFFGNGYAVVLWYNATKAYLSMQILTWTGQWVTWEMNGSALLSSGNSGVDLTTLNVVCGNGFAALMYNTGSNTNVHLFRQDPARPGQWVAATIPGGGSGGLNSPTLQIPISGGAINAYAGANFFLLTQINSATAKGSYRSLTWNWFTATWTDSGWSTATTGMLWFTAGQEYFASCDQQSNVVIHYLNAAATWRTSNAKLPLTLTNTTQSQLSMVGGVSLLAISQLISKTAGSQQYKVCLVQWNSAYVATASDPFTYTDSLNNAPTTWMPQIVNNSMVAVAGNVLRFDGSSWNQNTLMSLVAPSAGYQQRFTYGDDYAAVVLTQATGGVPSAKLIAFDANNQYNQATAKWSTLNSAQSFAHVVAPAKLTSDYPSGGNSEFLTIDNQLYARGSSSNWGTSISTSICDLQAALNKTDPTGKTTYIVNSQSMINQGPSFLACAAYVNTSPTANAACVFVFRNGGVYLTQVLPGQKMWTMFEGDAGQAGVSPGGPSAFVTYPDTANSFDSAGSITLHQFAGNAITGEICQWPVASIAIDDGMSEQSVTTYAPDFATASCDASGSVVQYSTHTVYPGGTKANPQNGAVIAKYVNINASVGSLPADYCVYMNGMLDSITMQTQAQVQSNTNAFTAKVSKKWQAFTQRAGDPVNGSAAPRNLYGAYVVPTQRTLIKDGVTSTQQVNYVPAGFTCSYSGRPASVTNSALTPNGAQETIVSYSTYAYQVNQAHRVLNDLQTPAAARTTNTISGTTVTSASAASTFAGMPSMYGSDVLVPAINATFQWMGGADNGIFPYGAGSVSAVPAGWLVTSSIQRYGTAGQILSQSDGAGRMQSSLCANSCAAPIFSVQGASMDECAWNSFQSYEDQSTWTLNGITYDETRAWLGTRSLVLARSSTLSTTVKPGAGHQRYLLGFRYQTASGYVPATNSGVTATYASGHALSQFEDTNGQWRYQVLVIDLAATDSSLTITAANGTAAAVWMDCVLLVPMGTIVSASAFEANTQQLRANMNAAGTTTFSLFDQAQRLLGTMTNDSQLQEIDVRFFSRQGSANGLFDDQSPNAELTLTLPDGGTAETFADGGAWKQRWTPGNADLWQVTGGALSKSSITEDVLVWNGSGFVPKTAAYFVEFSLPSPTSLQDGVGLSYFDDSSKAWYNIQWVVNQGWQCNAPGAVALASPASIALQLLLVQSAGRILFFGNGQLIFSYESSAAPSAGGIKLTTGKNSMVVHQLMTGYSPRLSVTYLDGASRQRQVHQLGGDDSLLAETIYDALDRTIASTRIAPGSYGAGAKAATLQYRNTFVDVDAFLQSRTVNGTMQGDVVDYYSAGNMDGTLPRSNDEGYPYTGTFYDTLALPRMIESGLPGSRLAINPSQPNRTTTRARYGQSQSGDPVAEGQFMTMSVTSPGGAQSKLFVDTYNRPAATTLSASGQLVSQTKLAQSSTNSGLNGASTVGNLQLPCYFSEPVQGGASQFARNIARDALGRITSIDEPNSGTTRYLTNGIGQPRFIQTAMEDGEAFYMYSRYDAYGRIIEEGVVNGSWDQTLLAGKVNDSAFPSAADGAVVARTYEYDGDGSTASDLGQLTKVTTYNPDTTLGDCTVVEEFDYDALGNVRRCEMTLSGACTFAIAANYTYNHLNQATRVDISGACAGTVTYGYDALGNMVAVGNGNDDSAFATYLWDADGQIQSSTRGAFFDAFAYDSAGNPIEHQVSFHGKQVFVQNTSFNVDCKTSGRSTSSSFKGSPSDTNLSFHYNNQQWLDRVTDNQAKTDVFRVDSFDANGNMWAWQKNGVDYQATGKSGTDQLVSLSISDARTAFSYRQDGRAKVYRGLTITYNQALAITSSISDSSKGTYVRFARGNFNTRVLKQSSSGQRITFYGAGSLPLVVVDNGVPQLCVWGGNGLEVVVRDGSICYPIKDQQGTVWAVCDENAQVLAAFDYEVYGAIKSKQGALQDCWPFHYAGKEWDENLGLYDFEARLYDPQLMRFLAPDSAYQFASRYMFGGNNPLDSVDPTGNLSVWARVGIGVGIALAGTLALGVSAVAFEALAAYLAADAVEAAAAAGAVEGAANVAADAGAEGGMMDMAGANVFAEEEEGGMLKVGGANIFEEPAEAAAQQPTSSFAQSMARSVVDSAIWSAGMNGLKYDQECGRNFSVGAMFKSIGVGAATGALAGAICGLADAPPVQRFKAGQGALGKALTTLTTQALASLMSTCITSLLIDAVLMKKPSWKQMGYSALVGMIGNSSCGLIGSAPQVFEDVNGVKLSSYFPEGYPKTKAFAVAGTQIALGYATTAPYTVYSNQVIQS